MRLDELERLKKYRDEDELIIISAEIGDIIRFRGYNKEQLLCLVNELLKINLLSVNYKTREQILDTLCDAVAYYDIHNIVKWDSVMNIKDKLEDDLQEYVEEFIEQKFEDEFMDLQSGLISLCLEVVGEKVSKVYAYCSNEKKSKMFNAFFDVNGEIKTLDQLGVTDEPAFEFLRTGTEDLVKVDDICTKYNMRVPTEMKLYYDVKSGKFDAEYKYEEICSAKTGKSAGELFIEWVSEIRG